MNEPTTKTGTKLKPVVRLIFDMDLDPVEELDLDEEILEAVGEPYCASCVHVKMDEEATSICLRWDEPTEIKPGWACSEYRPQGFDVE